MRNRILLILLAAAVLLAVAPTRSHAQSTFVEGHVFNQRTGVPLANAFVVIQTDVALPAPGCDGCSQFMGRFTDSNGFYSFEFSESDAALLATDNSIRMDVSCAIKPGETRATEFSHPLALREGTIRRDFYVNASRKRAFSQCLGFQFVDPRAKSRSRK